VERGVCESLFAFVCLCKEDILMTKKKKELAGNTHSFVWGHLIDPSHVIDVVLEMHNRVSQPLSIWIVLLDFVIDLIDEAQEIGANRLEIVDFQENLFVTKQIEERRKERRKERKKRKKERRYE